MKFHQAINETPALNGAWRPGLQALKKIDRNRVDTVAPKRLKGSVDVEGRLLPLYPGARHWDYAVGFGPAGHHGEIIYWIEVHPANDREVAVVLEKLRFLQGWLREHGQSLETLDWAFIWISSGKTTFTRTSRQQKRFAEVGLRHVGGYFKIPEK
jgi:hypothetical protein